MERRKALQEAAGGLGALVGLQANVGEVKGAGRPAVSRELATAVGDQYRPPEWLDYSRAVYFDGYSPPVYPHMRDFDARRLLETVTELGGNLLRGGTVPSKSSTEG